MNATEQVTEYEAAPKTLAQAREAMRSAAQSALDVQFAEHKAEAAASGIELVKQSQVDAGSLEALADSLLQRVAKFFGEAMSVPEFCGISCEETRGPDGGIISLKLIACDMVGGNSAKRG